MFESLTDKPSKTLKKRRGKPSEINISDALAEVRKALLSADVHYRTAREFVEEAGTPVSDKRFSNLCSSNRRNQNDELVKSLEKELPNSEMIVHYAS